MRTLLVCNHKGGVGKTTIALHLACLLEEMRDKSKKSETPLPVGAVDADPQGSLAKWHSRALGKRYHVPDVHLISAWELPGRLGELSHHYSTLVIDTAPTFSPAVVTLAQSSEAIVVPVTPGAFELDAVQSMRGMPGRERMRFVLNRSDRGVACRKVRSYLESLGPVSELRNYAIYRTASLMGGPVVELQPKSEAAIDLRRLAREVFS